MLAIRLAEDVLAFKLTKDNVTVLQSVTLNATEIMQENTAIVGIWISKKRSRHSWTLAVVSIFAILLHISTASTGESTLN